jgi:geranylgeranyl diphosphate synthase, type I
MTATGDTAVSRTPDQILNRAREQVEPALRQAVSSLPPTMQRICAYHFGWCDEDGAPDTADSGKAMRPALALLAAEAVGGNGAQAVPAAVAVELVHNFSLLHDDVMDGDTTRRHRRTAWAVFGAGPAVLAGDSLLTLAMEVLAASGGSEAHDALRILSHAVQNLIDGQSADLGFETRPSVSVAECIRMSEHKTGALLGCACALGAVFGGGQRQVALLREFGHHLGLAFQHADDLLGIWGSPEATGKPVHSDLSSRKKSLPVVAALASQTPAARELAALFEKSDALSASELAHAARLVEAAGGRAWSRRQAEAQLMRALARLRGGDLAARPAAELAALASMAVNRDH